MITLKNSLIKDDKTKNTVEDIPLELMSGIGTTIPNDTASNIAKNSSIMTLFPDVEMAGRILISSILSPKDGNSIDLLYKCDDSMLDAGIVDVIMNSMKSKVKKVYGLENRLYDILMKSMYSEGSHFIAYIPPKFIVDSYNSNLRDLTSESIKNTEILSTVKMVNVNAKKLHVEGVEYTKLINRINKNLILSDNPYSLELDSVLDDIVHKENNEAYGITQESVSVTGDTNNSNTGDVLKIVTPNEDKLNINHILNLKVTKDIGNSRPIEKTLPIECVIPIHVPDDVTKHLGYIVMLDSNHRPLTLNKIEDQSQTTNKTFGSTVFNNEEEVSDSAKQLKEIMKPTPTVKNMSTIAKTIIMNKIINSINTTTSVEDIELDETVLDLLLNRVLEKQRTRILYLPKELMVNYTYEYKENGLGRSLLDKILVLSSLRASLFISKVVGNIHNSIPKKHVTVTIPESDKSPKETVRKVTAAVLQSQGNANSMFVRTIGGLADWSAQVGTTIEFNGKGVPDLKIDKEDVSSNVTIPDDSLEEDIKDKTSRVFSLTKDMIDGGYSGQLATSIINSDILFSRRVLQEQLKTNTILTNHVKTILNLDGVLLEDITLDLISNFDNIKELLSKETLDAFTEDDAITERDIVSAMLNEVKDKLTITLPAITSDMSEEDSAYDDYTSRIEVVLEDILSDGLFVGTEVEDNIPELRSMLKSVIVRKWVADNNYAPDVLSNITNIGSIDDRTNTQDIVETLRKALTTLSNIVNNKESEEK